MEQDPRRVVAVSPAPVYTAVSPPVEAVPHEILRPENQLSGVGGKRFINNELQLCRLSLLPDKRHKRGGEVKHLPVQFGFCGTGDGKPAYAQISPFIIER